jgi:hypothetical protein
MGHATHVGQYMEGTGKENAAIDISPIPSSENTTLQTFLMMNAN